MTFSADTVCLPDVNVWIAATSDRHEHHAAARQWFDSASGPVCFCRLTQMAFLRLLTNPKVMSDDILSPADAIAVYRQLFSDERVRFEAEPPNLENAWVSLMTMHNTSASTWRDAYLAAFAMEAELRLISFDRGMRRWPGLALELLSPA
jgi:toxin-antitoxin system PIN domain toxin